MKELKLVALLVFVDFPFSFGVQHLLGDLLNLPDVFVGAITVALTVLVNMLIQMVRFM